MPLLNTRERYGHLPRTLHWTGVALLLTMLVTSAYFEPLTPGAERARLVGLQVSYGVLLLGVMRWYD